MDPKAARARAKLDHPLIDGDSHIIEYTTLLLDYIRSVGGADLALRTERNANAAGWYGLTDEERRHKRAMPRGVCERCESHLLCLPR